ncbi:MAG: hypothetical protein RBR40_11200, partial [Tenuifilaceae bacterium]|nr:hypothetical protein [Tenuifilaceae bacterium]
MENPTIGFRIISLIIPKIGMKINIINNTRDCRYAINRVSTIDTIAYPQSIQSRIHIIRNPSQIAKMNKI